MAVTWEVLDSVHAVEPIVADWDRLAVDANLPYCAPAWLMAWWRHASPDGARLAVVAVRDGERLLGVGPFYACRWGAGLWTYSLMGTDTTSRIEPLAEPAERDQVTRALAEALATAMPRADRIRLEGIPVDSDWPAGLCEAWPARRAPWHHCERPTPAPIIELGDPDVETWLASRSSNFRQQMRRSRRKADKNGGVFRIASTPEEIARDLVDFERLHNARWDWRGGSTALTPGTTRMLADAGRDLVADGRFLLISLVFDGRVANSQLFIAAGREISYWNGGFDDAFASYKPAMIGLVEAIRVSVARAFARFDLGPGAQEYKYRFTDDGDLLVWQTLIPPGPRYALARALFAPKQARHGLSRRLTPEQKKRFRALLERAGLRR